jgi:hypothetical protein
MSATASKSNQTVALVIKIAAVIAVCIWGLKKCNDHDKQRVIELKGQGMLEAKGFYSIPSGAGTDYYWMVYGGEHSAEDFTAFFRSLRVWQAGCRELSKRGLSESEIRAIPYYEICAALEHQNAEAELKKLIRNRN